MEPNNKNCDGHGVYNKRGEVWAWNIAGHHGLISPYGPITWDIHIFRQQAEGKQAVHRKLGEKYMRFRRIRSTFCSFPTLMMDSGYGRGLVRCQLTSNVIHKRARPLKTHQNSQKSHLYISTTARLYDLELSNNLLPIILKYLCDFEGKSLINS